MLPLPASVDLSMHTDECHLRFGTKWTRRAARRMSICLWGQDLSKADANLLSSDEIRKYRFEHACIQRLCYRDGKLVPKLVARSATVRRVVAEVYATSSEHRRAAAKRKRGYYRGVSRYGNSSKWREHIEARLSLIHI